MKEAADLDAKSAKEKAQEALKLLLAEKGQRAQVSTCPPGRTLFADVKPPSIRIAGAWTMMPSLVTQEKTILAAGRKLHPFMQPRSASAASTNQGASKPTQIKLLQLQPCIPPLHITQVLDPIMEGASWRACRTTHIDTLAQK